MFRRICVALFAAAQLSAGAIIPVNDDWIKTGETKTMTKDNTYVLQGHVFVDSGAVLTIEAGTVIQAMQETSSTTGTALIVAPRAKIYAEGTASEPIIFTPMADNPLDSSEQFDKDNITTSGLWGGVVILGRASINTPSGYKNIEGIPTTEKRGFFGGGASPDDDDNSGVFRYVSIRFGGFVLGGNNEINGLTLGAVGRGTKIEYVEVFNNVDDGFEWFGGTVNCRYLVAAFCGDDAFDWDDGFRGRGQYWLSVQAFYGSSGEYGDKAGEHDGGDNYGAKPYSIPIISNATYFGTAANAAFHFKENTGGKYFNSYIRNFESGIFLEDEDNAGTEDCRKRVEDGELFMRNCAFWNIGDATGLNKWYSDQTRNTIAKDKWLADSMMIWGNVISDDPLASVDVSLMPGWERIRDISGHVHKVPGIDYRPTSWGDLATKTPYMAPLVEDETDFIEHTYYKGAFAPWEPLWVRGWTAIDHYGFVERIDSTYLDEPPPPDGTDIARAIEDARRKKPASVFVQRIGNSAVLAYTVRHSGMVRIKLFDADGSFVRLLEDQRVDSGTHRVDLTNKRLSTGLYVCTVETPGGISSSKAIVVK